METFDLIATCAFGLESVVIRELEELGYAAKGGDTGRVHFAGGAAAVARTNLWLRSADRVLIRLGAFQATDFGVLFEQVRALPLERWIPADAAFPVRGRSVRSQLSSVPACQRIVKKAVVERLRAGHRRAALPETGAEHALEVALLKDEVTLTLDTSGVGLSNRGYRTWVGEAPLRETLAAALVLLARWRPAQALVDPFCGSGTIPIEAALIGRRLAPGLAREFAAERFPLFPAEAFRAARAEARDLARPAERLEIAGTDRDGGALALARRHAQAAGVLDTIHFQQRPFERLESRHRYGLVLTNPPYGERLGRAAELDALYASFPLVLRRLATWSHGVLTAYPGFERTVGRPADRRRKLYNARIECTFYEFRGPRPGRATRADEVEEVGAAIDTSEPSEMIEPVEPVEPVESVETVERVEPIERVAAANEAPHPPQAFGGLTAHARGQAEAFKNRLVKRARHLRRWPEQRGITCYRLYDRDIPEVPLVVDRYEDCLHLAEYERPHDRTPAEHEDWLDLMRETAAAALGLRRRDVFLKRRRRQRGPSQYEVVAREARTLVAREGGLRFAVNLSDYLDTGLFLDHRVARAMIRERAAGKSFLNLFCYTGSFTVYAAAGGARETTSVDLSRTYLDWARHNLELNDLAAGRHAFVEDDVRGWLEQLDRRRLFDLMVVDPPTFSNSKSLDRTFEVRRDHPELLHLALRHLAPGGELFFSTNFRGFRLDPAAVPPPFAAEELSARTVPEDFRNRRVHRCFLIREHHSTPAR